MLFLGKINILENHKTCGGANIFPTRNRLPDPKYGFFVDLVSFLVFSLVFQNKLWWRLQTLYFSQILFLVRRLVAISITTDGNSTGDVRESGHLFGCAKLIWFFFIFFLSLFFFLFGFVYFYLFLYVE